MLHFFLNMRQRSTILSHPTTLQHEGLATTREVVKVEKTSGDVVSVTDSHEWWLIHRTASGLRQHNIRRNEPVHDGGDNSDPSQSSTRALTS